MYITLVFGTITHDWHDVYISVLGCSLSCAVSGVLLGGLFRAEVEQLLRMRHHVPSRMLAGGRSRWTIHSRLNKCLSTIDLYFNLEEKTAELNERPNIIGKFYIEFLFIEM